MLGCGSQGDTDVGTEKLFLSYFAAWLYVFLCLSFRWRQPRILKVHDWDFMLVDRANLSGKKIVGSSLRK